MAEKLKRYILGECITEGNDTLIISDPCYKISDKLNIKIPNLKPGKYLIWLDTEISPCNENFWLNAFVGFSHESEIVGFENGITSNPDWDIIGKALVDSGTLGIFLENGFNRTHSVDKVDKEWYRNLKHSQPYFLGNTFNEDKKLEISTQEKLQIVYDEISEGVIFSTCGDGTYNIYGKLDYNNCISKFIISLSDETQNYEAIKMLINPRISVYKENGEE